MITRPNRSPDAALPHWQQTLLRLKHSSLLMALRKATSELRPLPNFLIIGTQKGGTTSLFRYLSHHPLILRAWVKEVQYFHAYAHLGSRWYRAHFPTTFYHKWVQLRQQGMSQTFEATPDYLFHPHVAMSVAKLMPNIKLIVLLRNPVARAYSHYQHAVRYGRETQPFDKTVRNEDQRLAADWERLLRNEPLETHDLFAYSYLARGRYAEQLARWFEYFPREQISIYRSEDFYADPQSVTTRVIRFLGLPMWQADVNLFAQKHNSHNYLQMSAETNRWLQNYFVPHNAQLYELLQHDFGW